ncbi:gamma-2-syntrophin-like isoform X2 [Liolophura sinensis]|uniref:gamma-2-syntrophin-like isoform X2 n=1 Tax=Liolophura sinensis TaxID=3198878 RepID=UPI003158B1D9
MSEHVRYGMVAWTDGKCQPVPMRLYLTDEHLSLQKEEVVYATQEDADKGALLQKLRNVTIYREPVGGLGLSVKGGAEHKLPVLISRIFKNQAADKTGQLFVGDAILKVNGANMEHATHEQVVKALRNAGDMVTVTTKHFRPASHFLSKGNTRHEGKDIQRETTNNLPRVETRWTDTVTIPLMYSYLSRYTPGTDKIRPNSFEVFGADGNSSGIIQCEDSTSLSDWIQSIQSNSSALLTRTIQVANRTLLPSEQIHHFCWVFERISPTRYWQSWKAKFLALRGSEVFVFEFPPCTTRDWARGERIFKVYDCMFKIMKDTELLDDRHHCFLVQAGNEESVYMSMETRTEVLRLEKAWHRANHMAVTKLGSKTFGCSWRGSLSGLTLDINSGFSLYDSESRSYMWSYKFSQLKGSSDDGKTKLKLHFQNSTNKQIETREVECTNLKALLFSIHAFLSAKLASVDPAFLQNC